MNPDIRKMLPPELASLLDAAQAAGASVSVHKLGGGPRPSVLNAMAALGLDYERESGRAEDARRRLAAELIPVVRQKVYEAEVNIADLRRRDVPHLNDEFLVAVHRVNAAKSLLAVLLEEAKPAPTEANGVQAEPAG